MATIMRPSASNTRQILQRGPCSSREWSAPPQLRSARRHGLDRERAADVDGTLTNVRQAAFGDVGLDASPVVDDLDAQVILDRDLHGERGGPRVSNGIADR